jgi:hypothetical protein
MTRRLEERVTCEDDQGNQYEIEVYREITRLEDGSQELGRREAFMPGVPPRPVKAFDDQNTFETSGGKLLRRSKHVD